MYDVKNLITNLSLIKKSLDFYQEFSGNLLLNHPDDYIKIGKLSENINKCIKDLKKE